MPADTSAGEALADEEVRAADCERALAEGFTCWECRDRGWAHTDGDGFPVSRLVVEQIRGALQVRSCWFCAKFSDEAEGLAQVQDLHRVLCGCAASVRGNARGYMKE